MDSTTGDNYQFPGRQWLDKKRGDQKLSKTFNKGTGAHIILNRLCQCRYKPVAGSQFLGGGTAERM